MGNRIDKTTIVVLINDFDAVNSIISCGGYLQSILPYSSSLIIRVKEGLADPILKKYQEHPNVIHAAYEEVINGRILFHTSTVSEGASTSVGGTKLDYQSHLGRTNVLHAHNYTEGLGAIICVADQGVSSHPDLNLIFSIAPGYADREDPNEFFDCAGEEYLWDTDMDLWVWDHGTDCAGLIGCRKGNSVGYCGIAPEASLYGLAGTSPFWQPSGCRLQMPYIGPTLFLEGVLYLIENHGVKIFSFSWGTPFNNSTVQTICSTIWNSGGLVIAAANNDGWDVDNVPTGDGKDYPLSYPNVIGVAAASTGDDIQTYPNAEGHVGYGSSISLVMPTSVPLLRGSPREGAGVNPYGYHDADVYVNWENSYNPDSSSGNIPYNHVTENLGCSFAGPQVAGIAALIWSIDPTFTNQEVSDILLRSYTKPRGNVNFYTYFTKPNEGCGIGDAGKAVKDALVNASNYTGTIYPSMSLYGPGAVWSTIVDGTVSTNLNGTVYCDITGYAGSNVNEVELWIGETMIYQGVSAILTLSCLNNGTPQEIKIVAKTINGLAYETYTDIIVSDMTLTNIEAYGSSGAVLKNINNYTEVILKNVNGILVNLMPITV